MRYNITKYFVGIFVVSLIMLVPNLGVLPVNIMEARNFITAREMVQDGNWILTTMNGIPRYEKPPLPTWMTAAVGFIFGFKSVFILRLAVVGVTLLLVCYVAQLSLRIGYCMRGMLNNSLIVITSFYIYFAGRDNQWDIYCHSFMIVSIYYLLGILKKEKTPIKDAVLGGLFLAFSILSKGPISLYTLLIPFLMAYGFIYKFNFKEKKYNLSLLLYILIGVVLGASWSLYIHWVDPEPLADMAKTETGRWTSDYNSKPFYYYWSFFTQTGIWTVPALLALIYPYMKNKVHNLKLYQFSLIWTLGSLILLSVVPEKKMRYILPVLIPLAFNTSFYIEYLLGNFKKLPSVLDRFWANFGFGLLGVIGLGYPFLIYFIFRDKIAGEETLALVSSIVLFIIGGMILYFLIKKTFKKVLYSVIALQCAVMIFVFPLAKGFVYNANYKSPTDLNHLTTDKMEVYDYKYMTPEIVWEYGKKIPVVDEGGIEQKMKEKSVKEIGLLCGASETQALTQELQKKYKVYKISYIDLNIVSPGNKEYKSRLFRDFLVISKK